MTITSKDTNSIKPVEIYLSRLGKQVKNAARAAVEELAQIGVDAAKSTTLFKIGSLSDHIYFEPVELSATIKADREYAYWLEEGNNQLGEFIYPVQAKALHFFIDGEEIFATKVHSHGPLPFMSNARDRVEDSTETVVNKHLNKAIKDS